MGSDVAAGLVWLRGIGGNNVRAAVVADGWGWGMQRSPVRVPIWRETRHEKPRRFYAQRHSIARAIDNRRVRRWAAEDEQDSSGAGGWRDEP